MRFSLTVKKTTAAALSAIATLTGAAALTPAAQAEPGNTVLVGDSIPSNPRVDQYFATAAKLPNTNTNLAGCATDSSFSGGYAEASGRAVADYTCPGASFFTGGRHISDLLNQAADQGDLNGATTEVVLLAGANDTYPHLLQERMPIEAVQEMIRVSMIQAIDTARAKAPNARIKVVGYPQISNAEGLVCPISLAPTTTPIPGIAVGPAEAALQAAGQQATQQTGSQFVDLKGISAGHDMCSPERWIVGFVDFGSAPRALPLHLTWDGINVISRHAGRA